MILGAFFSSTAVPATSGTAAPRTARAEGRAAASGTATSVELGPEALALISKLKARDSEVRQHEQAHLAAAGGLALSGASYTYQRGPDGVNYAVGGEVQIDTSPGATPEETIARANAVAAAALAPADPSGADLAVAAQAQQQAQQAQAEIAQRQTEPIDRATRAVQTAYGQQQARAASIDTTA